MSFRAHASLLSCLAALSGCIAHTIDRVTVDKVLARANAVPDLERGCTVGHALGYPLEALVSTANPPSRALIVADLSGGLCAELAVREAQLDAVRAEHNLGQLGTEALIAEVKDARERERRAHEVAARRFYRSWQATNDQWGLVGEGACPTIQDRDEVAYLLGLTAGLIGLLHDRAAGGPVGIPLDVLNKVARGSECLADGRWWHVPSAMRGAAWATVPGSGPEGVDPWQLLELAGVSGSPTGVRVARALQVVIASNNGQPEVVRSGIRAFAESRRTTPTDPTNALFDDYALHLVRHESDLLWMETSGHRTLELGVLPGDGEPAPLPAEGDPFGEGGFGGGGGDPFGGP